jgi:hypothetical protein
LLESYGVKLLLFGDQRDRLLTTEYCICLKDATIFWTKQLFEISVVSEAMFLEESVDVIEQRTSFRKGSES